MDPNLNWHDAFAGTPMLGGGKGGSGPGSLPQWMDPAGFFNQPNYADASMPYLNQISGVMNQYLGPYNQNGLEAGNVLKGQYGALLNNPGGVMNQIGQNFQQSPGYQFQVGQATNAANNAASAGGYAGSPQEQLGLAQNVNGMADQDYYNWMNHAMGLYGQGLQGEQGMYNTGAQSASSMAEGISQALMAQAKAAYAGESNQHQGFMGELGTVGSIVGSMFGGGAGMMGKMGGGFGGGGNSGSGPDGIGGTMSWS